jgi:hypothetical protein
MFLKNEAKCIYFSFDATMQLEEYIACDVTFIGGATSSTTAAALTHLTVSGALQLHQDLMITYSVHQVSYFLSFLAVS